MLIVFEVVVSPGGDPDALLSAEVRSETMAQVMTPDEAKAVGFAGVADHPGQTIRLIAVSRRDAKFVEHALVSNRHVGEFRKHEVDG